MSAHDLIARMQTAFPDTAQRCAKLEQLLANLNEEAIETFVSEEDIAEFVERICKS